MQVNEYMNAWLNECMHEWLYECTFYSTKKYCVSFTWVILSESEIQVRDSSVEVIACKESEHPLAYFHSYFLSLSWCTHSNPLWTFFCLQYQYIVCFYGHVIMLENLIIWPLEGFIMKNILHVTIIRKVYLSELIMHFLESEFFSKG